MQNVYNVPRQLGIHGTHKGYYYLVDALSLALEDENNLILYSKSIFREIAHKYDTTPTNIDRNIRTLIEQCWNSPFRAELQKITPYRLEKKPTVGEFIDILYWHMRFMEN